jgi:hypothetical protein
VRLTYGVEEVGAQTEKRRRFATGADAAQPMFMDFSSQYRVGSRTQQDQQRVIEEESGRTVGEVRL